MNKIHSIEQAADLLTQGKVGVFPTDTAFGIGCRMDLPDAVRRVYDIRNRPQEKALLVLVSSVEMARGYVEIDPVNEVIETYWPGGLTIVLKCNKEKVPSIVRADGDTLAVRQPDHPEILKLIEKIGVPIVAPSANISGAPTPYTLSEVSDEIIRSVDFVLDGRCTIKGVSTIIDGTKKSLDLIRQGVIELK